MIKAIDTRYGGCNFRSRLEARWAVFFDHIGVEWQYEPQGYVVDWGDWGNESLEPENYLPDFYLPGLHAFVEVKGDMAEKDLRRLVKGVIPHGLSLGATGMPAVIILGDVPRVRGPETPTHVGLHFHKGDVLADRYHWVNGALAESCTRYPRYADNDQDHQCVGNDGGELRWNHRMAAWLTDTQPSTAKPDRLAIDGYRAARSSRFEFGRSGT